MLQCRGSNLDSQVAHHCHLATAGRKCENSFHLIIKDKLNQEDIVNTINLNVKAI